MLTIKETLEKCRDHWQWMADHPDIRMTYHYFYFNEESIPLNSCYCCEYTSTHAISCEQCPLKGYAWEGHCMESVDCLYYDWSHSKNDESRAAAAQRMVYACDAALIDLNLKEN